MGFRGGGTAITNYGGAPPAVAAASAGGGASTASRSDHTHAHTAALHQAGGEADLTALFVAIARIAAANGVASLDATTKLPAAQLPTTAEVTTNKGVANGYASLDSSGLIPAGQLPSIVLTDTYVVASQAAMLALAAHEGDVAVRTDLSESFILTNNTPGVLASWQQLLSPTSPVTSVAGRTGAVTLAVADVTNAESTANKGAANGYAGLGAGGLVPAAQLGSGTADATHFLTGAGTFAVPSSSSPVGAAAHAAPGTAMPGTTLVAVLFGTEDWDTSNFHSTSSNTERFVAPTTGIYKATAYGGILTNSAPAATDYFAMDIVKNAATSLRFGRVPAGNGSYSGYLNQGLQLVVSLTAGDYLWMRVMLTNVAATVQECSFTIEQVA